MTLSYCIHQIPVSNGDCIIHWLRVYSAQPDFGGFRADSHDNQAIHIRKQKESTRSWTLTAGYTTLRSLEGQQVIMFFQIASVDLLNCKP